MDSYKGFGLFNDLEDKAAQTYNRARILVNIVLDHSKKGKTNPKGAFLSVGYMNCIPIEDRKDVLNEFIKQMTKEGFSLGGSKYEQSAAIADAIRG